MYKLQKYNGDVVAVLRLADNNSIPIRPETADSADYQTYLKWLEEGNQPLSAEE
jgi:hypothetical protein